MPTGADVLTTANDENASKEGHLCTTTGGNVPTTANDDENTHECDGGTDDDSMAANQ